MINVVFLFSQVVYGGRGGSDGSGTLPKPLSLSKAPRPLPNQRSSQQVSHLAEEDLLRLRALERPSTTSLIRTSNLELMRPEVAANLRTSSPLNQQAPVAEWMSPIHNYSDVSSVSHRERSLPSTLLTNPGMSSISSPNFSSLENNNSSSTRSRTALMRSTDLHTIHEHLPEGEEGPPAYSPHLNVVQADIHHGHPSFQSGSQIARPQRQKGGKSQAEDPYFQRTTYRNADAMFPNYALNYPAPIHLVHPNGGTISPSRQYPPTPVQIAPSSYWQSLYVQPDPRDFLLQDALATSSPPLRYDQQPIQSPMHDYENMRYLSSQQPLPETAPAPPRPAPRRRSRTPGGARRQHRESSVIDGQLLVTAGSDKSGAKSGREQDQVSLVSEVLDAEVTALTNSSSPGSSTSGSTERKKSKTPPKVMAKPIISTSLDHSSSSGIASKNTSQHQTSSSSGGSQKHFISPESKGSLEPIFNTSQQPFYENWPPNRSLESSMRPKLSPTATTYHGYHYMQPLSIIPPTSGAPLPPLTPHQSMNLTPKPQTARGQIEIHDTSLDTPPSRMGSRPGSAHSAPLLDVSIDRHYEFDTRTPTDDLNLQGIGEALPRQWNRPYLGYNPRQRDREMGAAAQLAKSERVFSDSEIYSPVFPRGRPEAQVDDVSARVLAMKKEFLEYRQQQLAKGEDDKKSDDKDQDNDDKKISVDAEAPERLESLI